MLPLAAGAMRQARAVPWLRPGFLVLPRRPPRGEAFCAAAAKRAASSTGGGGRAPDADSSSTAADVQQQHEQQSPPPVAPATRKRRGRASSAVGDATSAADAPPTAAATTTTPTRRSTRRAGARASTATAAAAAAAEADADSAAAASAPLPAVDLASGPSDPSFASDVTGWVAFADLHVSHRTLEPSLEALAAARREAEARGAGVLFLGDFWDRRGDLPVAPLNAVVRELRGWDAPVLMLPGNHDQADLAGRSHALTPLAAACARAHVFTEPALWRGALWLPYRRDEALVRGAIASALRRLGGPPSAIFAHADVVRFIWRRGELFRSLAGLSSAF